MNRIKRLICWLGFHDYALVESLSEYAMKLKCDRCERHFALHVDFGWAVAWEKVAPLYEGRKK